MLVMARLVGGIRLSMAQATPPPSTGRRRVAASRPPWPGPRGGCLGLGSYGEGRSLPNAPAFDPSGSDSPPHLSALRPGIQATRYSTGDPFVRARTDIRFGADREPSLGCRLHGPAPQPAMGSPRGPLCAGARVGGFRYWSLALAVDADLAARAIAKCPAGTRARRTAETYGCIVADLATLATFYAAGFARRTAETYEFIVADLATLATFYAAGFARRTAETYEFIVADLATLATFYAAGFARRTAETYEFIVADLASLATFYAAGFARRTAETYGFIVADLASLATFYAAGHLARRTLDSDGPGGSGPEDRSQRGARKSPQDLPECLPSWNWARQGARDVIEQFVFVHAPAPPSQVPTAVISSGTSARISASPCATSLVIIPSSSMRKATGIAKMPYSLDSFQRSWSTTGNSKPYRSALRRFSATSPRVTMSTTRPPSRHSRWIRTRWGASSSQGPQCGSEKTRSTLRPR